MITVFMMENNDYDNRKLLHSELFKREIDEVNMFVDLFNYYLKNPSFVVEKFNSEEFAFTPTVTPLVTFMIKRTKNEKKILQHTLQDNAQEERV
jgi:hypothetical protein